jgi:hypothetical protein
VPLTYLERRLEGELGAATLVLEADDGLVPSTSVVAPPAAAAATQIAMIAERSIFLGGAVISFLVVVRNRSAALSGVVASRGRSCEEFQREQATLLPLLDLATLERVEKLFRRVNELLQEA